VKSCQVHFAVSKKTVTVEEWFTLALAAKRAGILIPQDCRHGVCGTCEVQTQPEGRVRACITLVGDGMIIEA